MEVFYIMENMKIKNNEKIPLIINLSTGLASLLTVITGVFLAYVFFVIYSQKKLMFGSGNETILSVILMVAGTIVMYFVFAGITAGLNHLRNMKKKSIFEEESININTQNKAHEIHQLIFSSAFKYMKEQYKMILMIGTVIAALLTWKNYLIGIGFVVGALMSCITAVFNMYLCTNANLKVAISANKSLKEAFNTSLKAGISGSLFTLGMSVSAVVVLFFLQVLFVPLQTQYDSLSIFNNVGFGMAFGCSFICIFGRLAGGIFTKAADVGADLVGKVEAELAEDDIRNPAVIADNVGDNVGDGNGMIVDVFESYVVTTIMGILWSKNLGEKLFMYFFTSYLVMGGIGLVTTYIAKYFVDFTNGVWKKLQTYFYIAVILNFILSTAWFLFSYKYAMNLEMAFKIIGCLTVGFVVSLIILKSTEYYTSSQYSPVKKLAQSATSGHGTNIIYGLSIYYICVALPIAVIIAGVVASYLMLNITGIIITALAMISLTGPIVTLDLIGPITDNAGGIAEMSQMGEEVRDNTDHLDAVGNVTKAMTKGFAIGAATFTAIATNMLFVSEVLEIKKVKIVCDITNPLIFVGLLIGGVITSIFCGLAMRAVGEAAKSIVLNVREQFLKNPEILNGNAKPDYMESIGYLTKVSIQKMIIPALLPIIIPIGSFFLYKWTIGNDYIYDFLMAISMGNTIMGIYTSISMTTTGGAWDNCKKYIEEGHFGGKGSEAHKCAVTGDTVGDPLKDTAGPALNVLIKVLGIVLSLFILVYK